jgi:putative ABC transport system permease protein
MGLFRAAAERAYRRLLVLYPAEFRADYGHEMSLLFRDRSRDERLLPLAWDVLVDTLRTAPREHIAMWQHDVRYALRAMRRNPVFSAVVVVSLALGIGANAAIFSFADALLLRPLPVASAGEVVAVRGRVEGTPLGTDFESVSHPDYRDLRERSRAFRGLVAHTSFSAAVATDPSAVPQLTLGVQPALGRGFRAEEDEAGGAPVAVLGHDAWQSLFGGDRGVLGRRVRLNGVDLTVVGVAPPRFTGLDTFVRPAAFVPLAQAPALMGPDGATLLTDRGTRGLGVKGRLAPGVGVAEAEAELATLARALEAAYPKTNQGKGISVRSELKARIERSPTDAALIGMLLALVALVLLIACANVGSLLVSRSATRAREIAVRRAMGAGRPRLVRQLLTESLMLALAGGALGLVLAYAGVRFFRGIPLSTDLPIAIDVRLDGRVLLFSLAAALASVVVFGLAPALRTARADLVPSLKSGEGAVAARGRMRGRQALVVAQVALSLVLLASGAGILRGFQRALGSHPGFRTEGLLLANFDPTVPRYAFERARPFYDRLLEEARRLPGVRAAALTRALPLSNQQHQIAFVPEGHALAPGQEALTAMGNVVSSDYFQTAGVPLLSGRPFRETDDADGPPVVIVNEEMARRHWPGQDPLGKRLRRGGADGPWAEVVGVARTHRYMWIGEALQPFLYMPYAQSDLLRMTVMLQADGDPRALARPLQDLVRTLGPDVPMHNVRTMEELFLTRGVGIPRMLVQTVGAMGLLGLTLALVGLYGLMAYTVSRRTREIGIRMAVGADRGAVLRMVLRQGARLALVGVAVGLVASAGVARGLASVIAGVQPGDPVALVLLPALLLAVTVGATMAPAVRAARIDPLVALRHD